MTSYPKLLVRSGPVVVAHSLPVGFDRQCNGRARSDQLGCGRPLCARPAPGPLTGFVSIVRSSCASSVLGAFMHASAPYIMCMQPFKPFALAGSPPARFDY